MHKSRIAQYDCTTGELQEGVTVLIPDKRKLRGGFMLLDLEGMRRLSMDKDITAVDWRVLAIVMTGLEYENWFSITQKEIAEELGTSQPNVARSLKKLEDKAIIVKGKKSGRVNSYRLNAFYGWKGRINKEYESTYETHSKLLS
jgi:predicted transcriptional regulator